MLPKLSAAALAAVLSLAAPAAAQVAYHVIHGYSKVRIAGVTFRNPGPLSYDVAQHGTTRLVTTLSFARTEAEIDAVGAAIAVELHVWGTKSTAMISGDRILVRQHADASVVSLNGSFGDVEITSGDSTFECGGNDNFVLLGAQTKYNHTRVSGERNTVWLDWGADKNTTWITDRTKTSRYVEDGIHFPWFDNVAYYNGKRIS